MESGFFVYIQDLNMKRIAITGMGAVTPIGDSVAEFWKNLVEPSRRAGSTPPPKDGGQGW